MSQSPRWSKVLLIITYDEHGGCYDHVLPPTNAVSPDAAEQPGGRGLSLRPLRRPRPDDPRLTLHRARHGVPGGGLRLGYPVRSHVGSRDAPGLAGDPDALMLPSKRIAAAPHLGQVLTRTSPRPDLPTIPSPSPRSSHVQLALSQPLNSLQKSLLTASAIRFGLNPSAVVQSTRTVQDALIFFKQRSSMAAS